MTGYQPAVGLPPWPREMVYQWKARADASGVTLSSVTFGQHVTDRAAVEKEANVHFMRMFSRQPSVEPSSPRLWASASVSPPARAVDVTVILWDDGRSEWRWKSPAAASTEENLADMESARLLMLQFAASRVIADRGTAD